MDTPAPLTSGSTDLDHIPVNNAHRQMAVATNAGLFCDGYLLGVVPFALLTLTPDLGLSALWQGLIGSSALIGLFIGSVLFGRLSDVLGRQRLYTFTIIGFLVLSLVQFFIQEDWQLFACRVLIGMVIGAEYAVGPALLSEFLPMKARVTAIGWFQLSFVLGIIAAAVVGTAWTSASTGEDTWRWILASGAVPAALALLLRLGLPESPRWLAAKGRVDEAGKILVRYFGEAVKVSDLVDEEGGGQGRYRDLFRGEMLRRVLFCGGFWAAQVTAGFALISYTPQVLSAVGIENANAGTIAFDFFQLAGLAVGLYLLNRLPRRKFLIWTFGISAIPLIVIGVWTGAPTFVLGVCFAVYAFVGIGAQVIELVYPAELFPTSVRSSGVGLATAVSRIGAALGTFLLPLGIEHLGIQISLLIGGVIALGGLLLSYFMAPETSGRTLAETSNVYTH